MIDIQAWMDGFSRAVRETFGERVRFIGLQGSYGRGEATDHSDIDMVVILDELLPRDLRRYREMLDGLPNRELICGFLSGEAELLSWEPSDLFHLYYDTKPLYGTLCSVKPLIDDEAIKRAIKMGACNIYHGCVHNMLHARSEKSLLGLYKYASFVVQARVYMQTGAYVGRQEELLAVATDEDRTMIEGFLKLKSGEAVDVDQLSEALFLWAQKAVR